MPFPSCFRLLLLPLLGLALLACSVKPRREVTVLPLCGQSVGVAAQFFPGRRHQIFFSLHHDEKTAIEAVQAVMPKQKHVKLVELLNDGRRMLTFRCGDREYEVDPNRIFSEEGIRQSLITTDGKPAADAIAALRTFRDSLLRRIGFPETQLVVTLHNNTEGNLTIETGRETGAALRTHVEPGRDPDDFFIVTEPRHFERLQRLGFNVELQNPEAPDDGSLSLFCARYRVAYVNVEAQHGHRAEQVEMLGALNEALRD